MMVKIHSQRIFLALMLIFIISISYGCNTKENTAINTSTNNFQTSSFNNAVDKAFNDLVNTDKADEIKQLIYSVKSLDGSIYYSNAYQAKTITGSTINKDSPFYIASMTKTMVATLILQNVEAGKFTLDSTLSEVQLFDEKVIEELHRIDGTSYGEKITLRQLLNHTSGLKDYLKDGLNQLGSETKTGVTEDSLTGIWASEMPGHIDCMTQKQSCDTNDFASGKLWKPWDPLAYKANPKDKNAGMLNFYLSVMSANAIAKPGETRYYSDTNYLILGLLLEKIYHDSLANILNHHLFEPLSMDCSYLSYSFQPNKNSKCMQPLEIMIFGIPIHAMKLNISWDWGGGGVVSTSNDLSVFLVSLLNGKLFNNPETLSEMMDIIVTATDDSGPSRGYGLGLGWLRDSPAGEAWGHRGAWGSTMLYFPEKKLVLIVSVSQIFADKPLAKAKNTILNELHNQGLLKGSIIK